MSRFSSAAAVIGVILLCGTHAFGAVVFSDNFDSYADTAAFTASWPVVGSQPTGTLSTAQAVSSPNSININAGSTTAVAQRNGKSFTETGTLTVFDQIIYSFDFYDEAPAAAPYRQQANFQDGAASATNQLIAMGLNNNESGANSGGQFYMARILGYTVPTTADPDGGPTETGTLGAGAYFKLNDFGVGARSLGWHNLKAVLSTDDGVATDYAFYVDNVLAEKVSDVGGAGTLRSYDNIRIGSGVSSSNQAWYDNMNVQFVPEPSSLALFAMGGLFLRRRRAA